MIWNNSVSEILVVRDRLKELVALVVVIHLAAVVL